MITLRQMEQLTGVSRRMLQDYNKIGLLKYRGKTPGGYWLYDEADADRLAAIQLLRSYGFTRKEVLLLLGDPDQPVSDVIRHAETALLERRDSIDQVLIQLRKIRRAGEE